jgi:MFS family permease
MSLEQRVYSKVDWRLLPFLFLCYILAYLDRVNVGFAKLQMTKALGLSDAAFASGAGIFFIGYFFFEVPSNMLLKRFGARTWIARIMISWGVISSAMLFVSGEWAFYVMRFLLGLAEAGFFPGIIYYLTLWYPSRLRSTRTAFFVSAIAVAGVLGNPVSGLIMDHLSGKLGLAGWQWLFLLEGLPSVLVGVLVIYCLDSGISEAKWLSAAEKALLAKNLAVEEKQKQAVRLLHAFCSAKVWGLCAVYFTLMIGLYGISFWLPTIVNAFGLNGYLQIGLVTAIPYAVAVTGMMLVSRSSDRIGERRLHYALTTITGGLGLISSGLLLHRPALSMMFLSIGALGVIGAMPVFWPIPSAFLGGTAAAAGIGLVNSLGNLGGYVGSNIPVWVQHFSNAPSSALYLMASSLFIGAILILFLIPKELHLTVAAPSSLAEQPSTLEAND